MTNTQQNIKSDKNFLAMLWLAIGVFGRVLPHPMNMTPMTSLALFGGTHLPRWKAFLLTLATLIISDAIVGKMMGYPLTGGWILFTYTGFAAVVFAGSFLRAKASALRTGIFALSSSFGFWIWTNFGVWIVDGLYPHNAEGLAACYVSALPFLRNALVGDAAWTLILFASFHYARKAAPKFGIQIQGA